MPDASAAHDFISSSVENGTETEFISTSIVLNSSLARLSLPLVNSSTSLPQQRSIYAMGNNPSSHSNSMSTDPELIVRQDDIRSQNIGGLFNNDLYSDLTLIVGEKRFKVHKNILAVQSEYFRTLLTNGMSESSKTEITIEEPNVDLFEKLLKFVYLGEMKFSGTIETIEMLVIANKYLFAELQKSIGTHLDAILSTSSFCSIYSAAYACSASDLMTKCLKMADRKPSEIMKADGFSDLDMRALNEIIRRDSFKPTQAELFEAISKWIAANHDKDAGVLLSNIRLENMPLCFLLKTVRPSKLFPESRILDAATVIAEKGLVEAEIGKSIQFTVDIQRNSSAYVRLNTIGLSYQHPSDTIARVKDQIRVYYNKASISKTNHSISDGSLSLYYQGTLLQNDRTLESYGIQDGARLTAQCK